jgi:acyl-CoA reductase-like NAD-dependent aldehyde dehydrogenase
MSDSAHRRVPEASEPAYHEVLSPIDGEVIERVPLASADEVARRIAERPDLERPLSRPEVLAFLRRLHVGLAKRRERLVETTLRETGFIASDSREIVDGAIEFLHDFELFVQEHAAVPRTVRHSYGQAASREMRIAHRPFRTVAAMVPQNASFTLAITILASALYAGCRVVLRPSLQCAASGVALAELLEECEPPRGSVLVVHGLATEFTDACYRSEHVDLIHYIGSNQHALQVFTQAFAAKKSCLLDGQGNGILYVDGSFPVEDAVGLITAGATRYNGETCTSVNGVLVDPDLHSVIRDALVESFRALKVGDPARAGTQVGPLFSEPQARRLSDDLRSCRPLVGGEAFGAYLTPCVVEGVARDGALVREGLFGPALWIESVARDEAFDWLRANQFPLSDTILSADPAWIRAFATSSRAARVTVNQDPSVESMFEPWGGYPPSGLNPVSFWIEKYRQAFQLDGRPRDILPAAGES